MYAKSTRRWPAIPVRGEGLAHRVAVELLPRYFVPPLMLKKELEHVNNRKPWLRRRA